MRLIDQMVAELQAAIDALTPIRDGWLDLDRAITVKNDGAPASFQCQRAVQMYDERLRLLHLAEAVLEDLQMHGYPDAIPVVMRPEVESVLQKNGATIMAALATAHGEKEAATATVYINDPIPRRD